MAPKLEAVTKNWYAKVGPGYSTAKISMTLLTYCWSEELRKYGVACSTLWPKTLVATEAVRNVLGGDKVVAATRTPEVVADAAYVILTSDYDSTNGRFFHDDEVLASTGVKDFTKYKTSKDIPEYKILPDGFV